MRNKIISIILYVLSLISISLYIYMEFFSVIKYNILTRFIIIFISCFLSYFGAYFLTKYNKKYKYISYKVNLIIWFILYIILLFSLTMIDPYFFRNGFIIVKWNKVVLYDYYYNVANFIPFRIIIKFIIKLINHEMPLSLFINNIFGNFIAFMPFAFFLPRLFKKENNTRVFIITMFIIVSIVEITQFLTLSGTFDIDDYVLNISGAFLMFKILKNKRIVTFIEKFFNVN